MKPAIRKEDEMTRANEESKESEGDTGHCVNRKSSKRRREHYRQNYTKNRQTNGHSHIRLHNVQYNTRQGRKKEK